MQINLSGRTAVVSGSTKGIGLATVIGLAEAGTRVVVNGRTQAGVDAALAAVRETVTGADVTGHAIDLTTATGCAALVEAEPQTDILVNNLGLYGPQDFFATSDETWRGYFEANVMSGVRLSRAYLPGMERAGWGRVIFVSSESALNVPADMIHYGMTKTANISVARGLAKRMAGSGVTVNSVLPGPTLSEGLEEMLAEDSENGDRPIEDVAAEFVVSERPTTIIRRAATPQEVANMIVYVASPQASATTGAALRVDGGVVDTIA